MYIPKKRYSFTRPFTKDSVTFYWVILKNVQKGQTYSRKEINAMGKYMTFQSLKEAGLLKNINGQYCVTSYGEDYIEFYENPVRPNMSFFEYNKSIHNMHFGGHNKIFPISSKQQNYTKLENSF